MCFSLDQWFSQLACQWAALSIYVRRASVPLKIRAETDIEFALCRHSREYREGDRRQGLLLIDDILLREA